MVSNYIVQITRGSGKTQELFSFEGEIETLVDARKIRDKLMDDNPIILNKSIGKGTNKLETLNKVVKNLFKQG